MFGLSKESNDLKTRLDELRAEVQEQHFVNCMDNAFRTRYSMTKEETNVLEDMMSPLFVLPDTKRKLKYSQHPVLANLNDYCNLEASRIAESAISNGYTVMTIGDSVNPKITKAGSHKLHNCIKIDSLRDGYRTATTLGTAPNTPSRTALMDKALYNTNNGCICTKGTTKCEYQAHTALAVHSLYDFSLQEINDTFISHGLTQLIAFLYIPYQLYDKSLEPIDNKLFYITSSEDDADYIFSMRDGSIPYIHNKEKWHDLANVTTITNKESGFTIVRETIRTMGQLQIVNFVRVHNFNSTIGITIPMSRWAKSHYLVPDVCEFLEPSWFGFINDKDMTKIKHYLVPSHVVDGLLSYSARAADESYNFKEVATLAQGYKRMLKIGDHVYFDSWNVDPQEYHRVVVSLFIIGANYRASRTKTISTAFNELKRIAKAGWFSNMIRTACLDLQRFFEELAGPEPAHARQQMIERKLTSLATLRVTIPGDITRKVNYQASGKKEIREHVYMPILDEETPIIYRHPEPKPDDVPELTIETVELKEKSIPAVDINGDIEMPTINAFEKPRQFMFYRAVPVADLLTTEGLKTLNVRFSPNKTEDPSFLNVVKQDQVPTTFRVGQCAMQSFYDAYYQDPTRANSKMSIKNYLILCRKLLTTAGIPEQQVNDYIFGGMWTENNCSAAVLPLLATQFDVDIRLTASGNAAQIVGTGNRVIKINIYHGNDHFSSLPSGGAKHKYSGLCEKIDDMIISNLNALPQKEKGECTGFTAIDLSCAPGYIASNMFERMNNHCKDRIIEDKKLSNNFLAYYYVGPGHLAMHKTHEERILASGAKIIQYKDSDELAKSLKENVPKNSLLTLIINDAAAATNTEAITDSMNEIVADVSARCKSGALTYVCKTFGNPRSTWGLMADFESESLYAGSTVGSERYYFLERFRATGSRNYAENLEEKYKKYMQVETNHTAVLKKSSIIDYAKNLFSGEFKQHSRSILSAIEKRLESTPTKSYEMKFTAVTGYASASKTTYAIGRYPKALFVSPTSTLQMEHSRKGVEALTFHAAMLRSAALVGKKLNSHIIVDECSQFYVEYLAILSILNEGSEMTILGDVHQTQAVNYVDKKKYTTFAEIGVVNNKWETYKIPMDIAEMLNKRMGYSIVALSDVKKSICTTNHNFSHVNKKGLLKVPVICFNSTSAKSLKEKGYNAHTITTYTGSRAHTVIFYIDSAAIQSKLLSKPEWIYTAMSRATNKLVFAGHDADAVKKYFAIEGTPIENVIDLNNVFINHENGTKMPELDDNELEMKEAEEGIVSCPVEVDTCVEIVSKVCVPANASDVVSITNPVFPKVEDGTLTTTVDQMLEPTKTRKIFRVKENISLVKKQVSDSTAKTLQTLIKRYSKKMSADDRNSRWLRSELAVGLSKALTGRGDKLNAFKKFLAANRSDQNWGLNKQMRDYVESLSDKLGNNKDPIFEEFNEFNQVLEFFMKRQTKFDPKVGFDQSDKVGQGVASMSKMVNILFSCYARFILDGARHFAKKCGKSVIIATHGSDEKFDSTYKQFVNEMSESDKEKGWTCNDFSEWDSTFCSAFTFVMWDLVTASGCPEYLATWFLEFRSSWTMVYRNKEGVSKLTGHDKQFSGQPFTICENSLMNMALTNCILEIEGSVLELYKGDDSAIKCSSARYSSKAKDVLAKTGHKTKLHNYASGEFAGWVCTNHGLFPDVVRYCAKFIDKDYRDEEHFKEALTSLKERLACVKSEYQRNLGCLALTEFYPEINDVQMSALFDFLKCSLETKFTDLVAVERQEI